MRVTGLVRNKDKILLLHMKPPQDLWEFPSGHIEFGETPEDAINREVIEETGLDCTNKGLITADCCSYRKGGDDVHEIIIAYLFETSETEPRLDAREHFEYKWATLKDIKKIKNLALTVTTIMKDIENIFRA